LGDQTNTYFLLAEPEWDVARQDSSKGKSGSPSPSHCRSPQDPQFFVPSGKHRAGTAAPHKRGSLGRLQMQMKPQQVWLVGSPREL